MKLNIKRLILWFAFVGCLVAIFSVLHHLDFVKLYGHSVADALNFTDRMLFRISSVAFFALVALGLFIELDFFDIKKKIPLFNKKGWKHALGWIILLVLALVIVNGTMSSMSSKAKNAIDQYNQQEIAEAKKKAK